MLKKMLDYLNKQKFVYELSMGEGEESYYTNEEAHFFIKGSSKEITSKIGIDFPKTGTDIRSRIMVSIRNGGYQKVTKVIDVEDDNGDKKKIDGKLILRLESDGPNFYYIRKVYYELFKSKKHDVYIPDYWHWTYNLLVIESGKPLEVDNVIGGVAAMRITGIE